jgi:uncharacterized protein YjbI with pentapeptide repeats
MNKFFISLISWFVGAYFFLFILCLYVHVNESNIIAKRANALLPKLNHENITGLTKVSEVQNMKRVSRPNFFQPHTLFYSLLGERQSDKVTNRILGKAIEGLKENLNGSTLNGTDLREANLSNGKLWEANLEKSSLHNAKLIGADLTKARLNESILINADLSNAILREASISRADLQGANLRNANLISTKLNFSNLRKADFSNANFFKADLSNAILNGANLVSGINITCDQIESAVIDKNTRLPDYILLDRFSSSTFSCKNLMEGKRLDLIGLNLANIQLHHSDLREINLSHTNLMQATLTVCSLDNADLRGANLERAKLMHTNFDNANLRKANLKGANLNQAYNLTCDQIESAVIDKNTQLPDYILLDRSSSSTFSCKNLMEGKKVKPYWIESTYN